VFYEKPPTYDIESHHTRFGSSTTNTIQGSVYNTNIVTVTGKQWEPKLPHSVLEFGVTNKSKQTKLHNTQKPVELLKWIIKYYSKPGDTVLDPTMGSGSTGVAAIELNRKFIGIEKDETIYQVAQTRLTSEDTTSSTEADDNNETNDGTN
jgi:DNA modification methylase